MAKKPKGKMTKTQKSTHRLNMAIDLVVEDVIPYMIHKAEEGGIKPKYLWAALFFSVIDALKELKWSEKDLIKQIKI